MSKQRVLTREDIAHRLARIAGHANSLKRLWQECRSQRAASHLQAMVHTHATVQRHHPGAPSSELYELPIAQLVPGDLIHLSAGDMVPADVRLLTARDLFINQSAFTGEAMPVEKMACELTPGGKGASESQSTFRASFTSRQG